MAEPLQIVQLFWLSCAATKASKVSAVYSYAGVPRKLDAAGAQLQLPANAEEGAGDERITGGSEGEWAQSAQ